ncbi:MAG: GNAT family N-acetyltransferase [Acidobacteria bacterium]|nr:MAG: GNAT family N-acetyltransferase [Acidobacteriota bacterium]
MDDSTDGVRVRALDTIDIGAVTRIDERIGGRYRPEVWERRIGYYLRRDPEAALVAEIDGEVAGFMLGEVRAGEFGLEEPTGWIEVLGVDPDHQGKAVGRRLAEAMLEHFRARGARTVRTLVDETMGDVAGFFERLGFEPATLKPYVKSLA